LRNPSPDAAASKCVPAWLRTQPAIEIAPKSLLVVHNSHPGHGGIVWLRHDATGFGRPRCASELEIGWLFPSPRPIPMPTWSKSNAI